jgi:ATP-dependent Lhr-like helicase
VREEAWPDADSADELHDALMWLTFMTERNARQSCVAPLMQELAARPRALKLAAGAALWVATERRGVVSAVR